MQSRHFRKTAPPPMMQTERLKMNPNTVVSDSLTATSLIGQILTAVSVVGYTDAPLSSKVFLKIAVTSVIVMS